MSVSAVVLGFDFGLKQIGVAVAQRITATATPLKILAAKEGKPNWEELKSLIDEWQPQILIVGHPINMDGSESDMAIRAKKFANRLNGRYGIPVEMHDERLTSFEIKQTLKENNLNQNNLSKTRKDKIDALAAAEILESWFRAQP